MSNFMLAVVVWCGLAIHVSVGVVAWRRGSAQALLPWLNLAVASCVVAYWAQRWYTYAVKGIQFYYSDQIMPLVAIFVCGLAVLSITGRYSGTVPHWIVFGVDTLAFVAAALFVTFFRMNRLF